MKEHIGRISLLLFSIVVIAILIRIEYKKEEVAETTKFYFQVGTETIQTWEKEDVYYLFLPAFVSEEDVILTPYSPEFYVINQGKKISGNESIEGILQGRKVSCQLTASGEKFKLCILKSENIPALFIDTNSGGIEELKADKEYKVSGTVKAVSCDGVWEDGYALTSIGGRGNTSFAGYEKKPFSITLNEAASILGLPEGQKYALISNASDSSLIRNDMARRMEMALELPFSHVGQFVDLYINGVVSILGTTGLSP